ncbi:MULTISPECIES: CGNR zinc finger domain-containing protein [unclassified Amycolatopsis]|uniref:CGNR zinc finger domain-containing protein n=1 Tax=unclassified Amycolatopsis TaxID=2618356 RepID=UPI002E13890D|nr:MULTISPECIES: CGNR zinc finger domain-containing protein [unclassified Amycolatopsis]WSK80690.1 CGNR zinc finger domain-containing protein [Amycolatopsis sp. NBC_01286]
MEWVFDGGRACLDLVNTRRSRHTEGVELLTGPDALAEWLGLAGFTAGAVTAGNVLAAKALREAIDRVLLAEVPAEMDVDLVNNAAAAAPAPPPRLAFVDGRARREVPPPKDPVATAFAALAADAIDLATGDAAVRVCAADDCGLRFSDASPRRNRQWCSMSRCGNRAKARAHYARVTKGS